MDWTTTILILTRKIQEILHQAMGLGMKLCIEVMICLYVLRGRFLTIQHGMGDLLMERGCHFRGSLNWERLRVMLYVQ